MPVPAASSNRRIGADAAARRAISSAKSAKKSGPQSWRSTKFNDGDPDSTLVLAFTPEATNGRVDLVHLDVPAHNYQSVIEGWETHYWGPWRRYLAG